MDDLLSYAPDDREFSKTVLNLEGILFSVIAQLEIGHVDLAKEQAKRALEIVNKRG